jgi:enterochelin esterase-like enzyme
LFRQGWIIYLIFIGVLVTVGACSPMGETGQAIVMPSPTVEPPPTSRPTITPAPSATIKSHQSPIPSSTPRPTDTAIPNPTASPTSLECWDAGGGIETGSLATDLLRLPLDYRVYLPPCYRQQPERRYPLLVLIHGQSYNDDQWDRLGADETADRLIAAGEIEPLIIVMPRDRFGGQPSENNFARVLVEELLPHVDQTYRTLDERGFRAVGGLSRGGGWAVHLALTYWDTFSALGGHSPAIFFDDAQRMRVYLDEIPPDSMPRIYLDIGDRDRPEIMRAAIWFEELLNQRGIPHEWYLFSGFHTEEYWQAHLETYLRWYTRTW